ncbi:MAG: MFS transporter [Sulfuriflexus sp.]|nr:MFS transporter [Sulfuriflexus sp.]
MNTFRRNIPLLATSQALMMSSMSLLLTTTALIGLEMAPDKALATLPIAVIFISVMLSSIPAAMLMERIGRKPAFMFSTLFGMAGGAMATVAILNQNFWLFTCSGILIGMFNAFGNYFRFAAADIVEPALKSKAISAVLLGGVVAAIVGPNLANLTRESIPDAMFAGSYMSIIVLYFIALVTLGFLKLPQHKKFDKKDNANKGRPLLEIVKQPKFIVALLCAMLGYGVMSFVMTATPLAMHAHDHSFSDTSFVISWHVLGMYAPSFFTGHLINRYGVLKIMFVGGLLGLGCVAANLLGNSITHYWIGLTLLGVGWNFLFIGGTTLLTETYRPEERSKTQAVNDFTIFTTVAIASLTAGALQYKFGWQVVNLGVIPLLIVILLSILWLGMNQRRERLMTKG